VQIAVSASTEPRSGQGVGQLAEGRAYSAGSSCRRGLPACQAPSHRGRMSGRLQPRTAPYLRIVGPYGSGKSRAGRVIGHLCRKPFMTNGATTDEWRAASGTCLIATTIFWPKTG
jgi:hypothetical protein